MAKPQTSIMAAILLATGWFFHAPQSSQEPPSSAHSQPGPKDKDAKIPRAKAQAAEGPWTASYRYWSSQTNEEPDGKGAEGSGLASSVISLWGLPTDIRTRVNKGLEGHAVIATVPDPVHGHLEMDFDRALNSLISATADNGYIASYAWLPWKMPSREQGTRSPLRTRPMNLAC